MNKQDEANVALVALMVSVKHTDPALYRESASQMHVMADMYHTKLKETLKEAVREALK